MTTVLKLDFHVDIFCSFLEPKAIDQAKVDAWVASFGPGFSTSLLTLQSGTSILYSSGTLYVLTEGFIGPDNLPGLPQAWSRDCVTVDAVTVVPSVPDAATEQKKVDDANPPGGKATTSVEKLIHDIEQLLGTVVKDVAILAVVLIIAFILIETKPWKHGLPTFKKVKRVFV